MPATRLRISRSIGAMALDEVVLGERERDLAPQFVGVWRGKVTTATASELFFTVDAIDPRTEFGPAPYSRPAAYTTVAVAAHDHPESGGGTTGLAGGHDHAVARTGAVDPPRGTLVAVAFEEGDPERPLVLALFGWPA